MADIFYNRHDGCVEITHRIYINREEIQDQIEAEHGVEIQLTDAELDQYAERLAAGDLEAGIDASIDELYSEGYMAEYERAALPESVVRRIAELEDAE